MFIIYRWDWKLLSSASAEVKNYQLVLFKIDSLLLKSMLKLTNMI
jgi:hypothetical protein